MKVVSCNCPNCGSVFDTDSVGKKVYCEYCGTPLFIDDESTVFVLRDEAKIKRAENEARRIELAEQHRVEKKQAEEKLAAENKQRLDRWHKAIGVTIAAYFLLLIIGLLISKLSEAAGSPIILIAILMYLAACVVLPIRRPDSAYPAGQNPVPKSKVALGFVLFFAVYLGNVLLSIIIS